jgi:hypothetical protein
MNLSNYITPKEHSHSLNFYLYCAFNPHPVKAMPKKFSMGSQNNNNNNKIIIILNIYHTLIKSNLSERNLMSSFGAGWSSVGSKKFWLTHMVILSAIFLSNFQFKIVLIFPHGDPERHLSFKLTIKNSSDFATW